MCFICLNDKEVEDKIKASLIHLAFYSKEFQRITFTSLIINCKVDFRVSDHRMQKGIKWKLLQRSGPAGISGIIRDEDSQPSFTGQG